MEKTLNISVLLDFYGALLTGKQYTALDMYYNMDYSLAEISENLSVTRQCARDFIKKGEARLLRFEETLGLNQRLQRITEEADIIRDEVQNLTQKSAKELKETENVIEKSLDAISTLI